MPKGAQVDLLLRCTTGVLSDILLFVAFEMTSFSKAFSIFFTNTLMAPFLSFMILGEPIKKWDIIGILVGFGGMLMLIRPFKDPTSTELGDGSIDATVTSSLTTSAAPLGEEVSQSDNSPLNKDLLGCGISFLAAVNAAIAIIYIRKLADQVHCALQPMYYMLGMSVFCPIWSLTIPVTKAVGLALYGYEMYFAIIGLACILFVQQATIAKSMQYNTVGIV